jgi:hypothetical protein
MRLRVVLITSPARVRTRVGRNPGPGRLV